MRQYVYVPETRPDLYISGYTALNLPAPETTSGDWHYWGNIFAPQNKHAITLFGEGQPKFLNTNHIFSTFGLYECSDFFKKNNISVNHRVCYAANHFRAILDITYSMLMKISDLSTFRCATDEYLDSYEQKMLVLDKAKVMLSFLSDDNQIKLLKWIDHEHTGTYKS